MPARMEEDRSASGNNRESGERLSQIPNRRSPARGRHSGAAKRNPESSVLAQTPLDSRVRGNDGKGH
jgi:hypothetical protein